MKNCLTDVTKLLLMICGLISIISPLARSQGNTELLWRDVNESSIALKGTRYIIPQKFRALELDIAGMEKTLSASPIEYTPEAKTSKVIISLPMPDGKFNRFAIIYSPVMAPELAAKYPEIKTYLGQGIDDRTATVRFDITPKGFHAMIIAQKSAVYIDPYCANNTQNYISYYTRDYYGSPFGKGEFICHTQSDPQLDREIDEIIKSMPKSSGSQLRTYRVAVAATGEYTTFHGGTVTQALAAIVTTMNRVNGIYEREVAIRLVLIANETSIIYTNASTDPYTNGNTQAMLEENQDNLPPIIGNANFDIGHVFGTNSGGLASLGVVCNDDHKAQGVTGNAAPVGDPFDIDYVAHEMGHQFSARHTFNGNEGSCGGNTRAALFAFEPGSGSTIMAYAGICGSQNLQRNSDPYFHRSSLQQIVAFSTSGGGSSCPTITNTGNTPPQVFSGNQGFIIPMGTPFYLSGGGSDDDGDALTYCWEEWDLGPAGHPNSPSSEAPIFRSFLPADEPTRTFPRIGDLMNNTQTIGELLPSYARTLQFSLTVRDNKAGGGGFVVGGNYLEVTDQASGFAVTYPNSAVTLNGGSECNVTWNVGNTNNAPVNCQFVKILLSTDGGQTYPTEILATTPNDGAETITMPNIGTTHARIRVEASGNFFFNISNVDFTIIYQNPIPFLGSTSPASLNAGGSGLTMTINGTGFVTGSTVYWNSSPKTTTYVSATQLSIDLNASDFAAGGYATISVVSPTPGGGVSNGLMVRIDNPVPTLSSMSPTNATAGGFGFNIIINGTNFVSSSVVTWNGVSKTTTYVSPTRIDAAISAEDIASGGTAALRVVNEEPGGGTSSALTFTISNPSPSVVSLTPSSVAAGSGAFTLAVYGVDFVPTSVVRFNTINKPTTYVSPTQLNASISAQDIEEAEYYPILVINPEPGGGVSNAVNLSVTNPVPTLSSISPDNLIAGGDGFTMTLTGTNFVNTSAVLINGFYRATTYISNTQLQAAITAGDRSVAGTSSIKVTNPVPGGGESGTVTFTVKNPVPYISSISPGEVIAGGDGFTLTVTGSNFMANSAVQFNGSARATTYISSTELQAAITASDRATGTAATITVNTTGPGGGVSNSQTLNVTNPVPYISSINPATVIAGGSDFTMTLTGQYFVPGSIVRVNGADRTTNYISATEIEAVITAGDRANGGTATITVFNPSPAGGLSNESILNVNNPSPFISSISPVNVTAGSQGFTLTVNGTYFVTGSVVKWNGSSRPTTFVSGSQLTAIISAEDIALSGTANVTVFSSTPGGGTSLEWTVTFSNGPTQQANNIIFTSVTENQATVDWADGNGSKRAVFIKRGSEDTPIPVNYLTYSANTSYGEGAQIGSSGWYCVFNGTTHSGGVTISGLTAGRYKVMVCEFNGGSGEEVYNINSATNNPGTLLAINRLIFPGNALDFDGVDDYVKCYNAGSLNVTGTSITLEAWVKARSWNPNAWGGGIIVKEGNYSGYMLRCGDNGKVNFAFGDGTAWHQLTTAPVLTLNRWHHIAAVYNGSSMKIYVDGDGTAAENAAESIAGNSEYLRLASSAAYPDRMFNGQIDEIRIWSTARSRSDLLANMYSALNGNETGLAAYYAFDNGSPSGSNAGMDMLYDLSSNASDGTLNNLALTGNSSNWVASSAGPPITVNLKMFIEGLYNTELQCHAIADTIIARLKSADGSFTTMDSLRAILATDGTVTLKFGSAFSGNYYLVINHRNALETWSKTGGEAFVKGSSVNYDFTAASSKAYGNNMKNMGSIWCYYSGDVNQDGIIDLSDIVTIDNDANNSVTGYTVTDLNGDGIVDRVDLLLCDTNSVNFVKVKQPADGAKAAGKTGN